jgi:hypothetical protein
MYHCRGKVFTPAENRIQISQSIVTKLSRMLLSTCSSEHEEYCEKESTRRMVSSGMLRRVALVRTDVLEELSASFIRVTRIGVLGTTLAVTSTHSHCEEILLRSVHRLLVTSSVVPISPILVTLLKEALSFFETSALTRATWRNILEDAIIHSHRRENLKPYKK